MLKLRGLLLAGAVLAGLASAADAQQTPFAPGDWQGRQIVAQGSTLQLLNLDAASQNGVVAAGVFGNAAIGSLTAAGTNLATCYSTTNSPSSALNVFSTVAAGTGVCLSGDVPFAINGTPPVGATVAVAGIQGITNAGANDLLVYPITASGTIDGGAAGAGVLMPPNSTCLFQRETNVAWVSTGCSIVQSVPAVAQVTWRTTDTVVAGTAPAIVYFPWLTGTITGVWAIDAAGTYTAEVEIGTTAVTGCSAIAVSTTGAVTACTAANALVKGNAISVVVSSPSGSPNGGGIGILFTHSQLGT